MSVPPDIMSLLQQGGGPPAAGPSQPVPEDIMSLLGGGGAEPAAPEEAPASSFRGEGGGDNVESLRMALDALQDYAAEEDDEQNVQVVLKCVTALQGILADEQKMADGMMSGKMDPRSLRRTQAAQGGGPSY